MCVEAERFILIQKRRWQVLFDFSGSRVVEVNVGALVLSQGPLNYGPLDGHELGESSDVDSFDILSSLARLFF